MTSTDFEEYFDYIYNTCTRKYAVGRALHNRVEFRVAWGKMDTVNENVHRS